MDCAILPIEHVSEPLITAPVSNAIAILNSEIRILSLEARIMVDHLGIAD